MSFEVAAFIPGSLMNTSGARTSGRLETTPSSPLVNNSLTHTETVERTADPTLLIAEVSDEQLLEQVQLGMKDALGTLFRRHARAVRNVAHRILRDEAEADDLVQEVFLFIFRRTAVFDARQGAARSWIIQMTYHRAFERRRYLNSRHFYTIQDLEDRRLSLVDLKSHLPFYESSMEGILGKALAIRFNARLSPQQRETIHLYFFEGYTLKEIAELTGHSLAKVRHQYYRGLERLRKYVLPESSRSK